MANKFSLVTLGCPKNEADSDVIYNSLLRAGLEPALDLDSVDFVIVNTCGFIEDAKLESINTILDIANNKASTCKLIVTGCLSQRYHEDLVSEIPEIDLFVSINDYDRFGEIILDELNYTKKDLVRPEIIPCLSPDRFIEPESHFAYLKIADGCDNNCSFCAIPSFRGRFRSKPMEDCIKEAKHLAESSVKELILVAQDTSMYGYDLYGRLCLPELINMLADIDGIAWIRLLYVYDNNITDDLINCFRENPKLCKYIDMPLQHVSDRVLKLMNRKSNYDTIVSSIQRLRENVPEICIRTTFMVGFPGETEQDFAELLQFVQDFRLDRVGVFKYSDEENTSSVKYANKVDSNIKEMRYNQIMEAQMSYSLEANQNKINKSFDAIIDEVLPDGSYLGRTVYDSPQIDCELSIISNKLHSVGDIINVIIEQAYEYDLVGREIY